MSSYLFHNATVLLARHRLGRIVASMERKRRFNTYTRRGFLGLGGPPGSNPTDGVRVAVTHQAVEDRVFALARAARDMFDGGGAIRVPAGALLGEGAGKFAVMGSIGLELPSMIEYLRPGQEWITAIMRRGTADPNFSKVIVRTTHFALRVGELALARAGGDQAKQRKIEAFVMGMLCSIAVEVVTNPILRGMQAAKSFRDWDRFSPAQALAAADSIIARDLLGSPSQADWESWWPTESEVPSELFAGFDEALREVFPLADPPRGFDDFAASFEPGRRPDERDLKNAYSLFRHGNITVARGWNTVDWWLFLLSVTLPPAVGMLIASPFPRVLDLFREDGDPEGRPVDSRAAAQILTTGYLIGIFTPFITTMQLHSLIPGDWDPYFDSIALFVIRCIGLLVFGGFVIGDTNEASHWILFSLLASTDLYALIRGFIELGAGRRGPALLYFVQALPIISMALVGLLALILRAGRWQFGEVGFWLTLGIGLVIYAIPIGFTVGWLFERTGGLTIFLRERREGVPLLEALPAPAGDVPRSLAHLFDDATLWREDVPGGQPLATHRYPAGRRAILKLRWTGDGDLEVNPRGRVITFLRDDGTRTTVTLPPQSVTAAELRTLLQAQMPGLEATVLANEPNVRFLAPNTVSDPGDEKSTFPLHDTHAGDFLPVGKTAETAFLLRHSPRSKLATPFGTRGQSCSPLDSYKLVPESTLHDLDSSALGMAADLASLLCVGAARNLRTGLAGETTATPPVAVPLTPAYRVLRQWNLDERRVNEWRMVVHGGAQTERYVPAGAPGTFADEGIRPGAPASPVPDGEALANAMGWIPLWRAWTRMAEDPLSDATGIPPERFTPPVQTAPGPALAPGNQQLSDALRFLLDLVA
jgi:hypothetical protein